jgi:hypothetical protein
MNTTTKQYPYTWLALVKEQLRNPPYDSLLFPVIFWMPNVMLLTITILLDRSRNGDVSEWHSNLVKEFALVTAIPHIVFVFVMILTWLYDKIKSQPSIGSQHPAYHRVYYIFKYALITLSSAAMIFCVVVAVYFFSNRSILIGLAGLGLMGYRGYIQFKGWTPSKSRRVDKEDFRFWGLILAMAGMVSLIRLIVGILGGDSLVFEIYFLIEVVIFFALGYLIPGSLFTWGAFFFTHLGLIRK